MQEQISISGNIIVYDEKSKEKSIDEILLSRFENEADIETSLDDLLDPYLLAGMSEAVARIKEAHISQERVIVFWDYDVDGVTSTSLLMHFFKKIWVNASYRLPHRAKDGYGLKNYFIDELASLGVSLIITVDCGTRDGAVVQYAKEKWIEVIITDHHTIPEDNLLESVCLINPKRQDCPYPFKDLAWVWVCFKLIMALARDFLSETEYKKYIQESIDIVAIGTVADCMVLTGENRIIVQEGLKQIKNSRSRGIKKMIEEKIHEDLDADIFSFLIGPKLNSAWRMADPYKAVSLILNQEESVHTTLQELENLNDKRRKLTYKFFDEAMLQINQEDNILFYHSTEIEHGIIGIVAGKLTERFYKPSIVLIEEGDKLVASCRSPEYFNIAEILEENKHFFEAFGGHKQAAWFTIKKEKFPEFKQIILDTVNNQDFSGYKKRIIVDKLISSDEIGFKLIKEMTRYKPFGIGNTKPIFMIQNLDYSAIEYLGSGVDHIKINHKDGYKICGFWFWHCRDILRQSSKISIIFDLLEDNFNGKKGIMLKVLDMIVE